MTKLSCYFFLVLLFLPGELLAARVSFVEVSDVGTLTISPYEISGTIDGSRTTCVASANDNTPWAFFFGGSALFNYAFKINTVGTPQNTPYYIFLDGNTGAPSNSRIAVNLYHNGTSMTNGSTYNSIANPGQFRNCWLGTNSTISAEVSEANRSGVLAGSYRGSFRATALGGSNNPQNTVDTSPTFNIVLTIPQLVQITNVTDIPLGTYDPATPGDLSATEDVCVYSNSNSGGYSITVTSSNPSGFELISGANTLAYSVQFDDDLDASNGTNLVNGTLTSGFIGHSTKTDCDGANNAQVYISVLATDIQAVPSGNYSDVLTLRVAPI